MFRLVEDLTNRAFFDDNAAVHHQHARTHARDNAEVVGDHDDGGAKLLLQALQQVENLRLNGHVQRGGWFVGDNQPRVAHDGHGDHDALAHAAGKLVRILLHAALRVRNFNQTQLFKHDFARFRFGNAFVDAQRLDQLIADGEKRVERGHRVLKDHADLIAADFAEHFGRECGQIRAVKDHFIRRDFGIVGQKVQHGEHRDALAAAAFADDADGFAFIHVQVYAANGLHLTDVDIERRPQVFNIKESLHRSLLCRSGGGGWGDVGLPPKPAWGLRPQTPSFFHCFAMKKVGNPRTSGSWRGLGQSPNVSPNVTSSASGRARRAGRRR